MKTIAIGFVILSGCASYDWHLIDAQRPPVRWIVAPISVIQSIPGCESSIACSLRFTNQHPRVVLATTEYRNTPEYVRDHEEKHCRGYDHS